MSAKKLGLTLAYALFSVAAVAGSAPDGGSPFPGRCEFTECYANLSVEAQKARMVDTPYAVPDAKSGLKHFYWYRAVPLTPDNVMGIFLNFPVHQFGKIKKAEIRKEPGGGNTIFEVYYELEVKTPIKNFLSKYIVQHQVFRDGKGGYGSMWRLSPLSKDVRNGLFNLTKPEEVIGYIYVTPKDGGSAVTYYSYIKASAPGIPNSMANKTAEDQLKETIDGFIKIWTTSAAPEKCKNLLTNAPILAGNP